MLSKHFLFSIIMPIYNVEQWLSEAIDSILAQKNINFEKDVQLILVNDCSPDNSEDICLKYQKRYPNNIFYVKNKINQGLSATRNNGLTHARGKYVNFFDPDDKLSDSVLYEVNKFFNENKEDIAHVSIPLVFFEAASGMHPKYVLFGNKNRIIDLQKEGQNFILSSASSFYKLDMIKNMTFDTSLFGEEDTLFNFNLYKNIDKIGYVCENNVYYHYRKRTIGGSQVDLSSVKPQAFHTPINLLNNIITQTNIDQQSHLFYELCIYQLRSRLKNIKPEIFESIDEYNYIISKYREFIAYIPKEFILKKTKFLPEYDDKIAFLTNIYSKKISINHDAFITIDNEKIFKCNELPIDIKSMSVEKNTFIIEVLFNNYDLNDLDIVLMDKHKCIIKPVQQYVCDSIYIKKSAGFKSSENILYVRFEIPLLKANSFKFYFKRKYNNYLHIINRIRTYSESPFLPSGVFNSKLFKLYSDVDTSVTLFQRVSYRKTNYFNKLSNRIKAFYKKEKSIIHLNGFDY
ncbi:glycosyltransferase family 2 protein [Neisseria zalophi]|uniref:Glycosyltransferase family 2 protein n=1 Tax=Neisseria zalophi TaxID=640030 RepID=A0A5J6PTF8_9NEIS|nr:glycosyltransferase family 2 protein [Neisseria zalophi]QEY25646.1 glycosyltransferase family 2 protein [Neisseria zalophi]